MDFLGNISMRLVGLIVTVGTLAAVYFFVIKPVSDTTGDAFDSLTPVFESVQEAQEQARDAQELANQQAKSGNPAQRRKAKKLEVCLRRAGSDIDRITACLQR